MLRRPNRSPAPMSGFVTKWATSGSTADQRTIRLPLVNGGTYNFSVDWGDGITNVITTYNDANITHVYATEGTFTVRIKGTIVRWSFNGSVAYREKLKEIKNWGGVAFSNVGGAFSGCTGLTTVTATDAPVLNIAVLALNSFFRGCSSLTNVTNIHTWNTAGQTQLLNVFRDCPYFNQSVNGWDTSSVTDWSAMFQGCVRFNQSLNSLNVSAGTNFTNMFNGCTAFNGDITGWVFKSSVGANINFTQILLQCAAFNQDIGSWNTGEVTNMYGMLQGCTSFNQNIGSWNVAKVTTMFGMFLNNYVFNQNLSGWDISNVTAMNNMFSQCSAFSTANYDALLIGWAALSVKSSVTMHMNSTTKYSVGDATRDRDHLITTHLWTITDGGQA